MTERIGNYARIIGKNIIGIYSGQSDPYTWNVILVAPCKKYVTTII